jgi:hypothetical protein
LPQQESQTLLLVLVNGNDVNGVSLGQHFSLANTIIHHGEPGRVLEVVFVEDRVRLCVVGRVQILAIDLGPEPLTQEAEGLEVLPLYTSTVYGLDESSIGFLAKMSE